ncbi:MAG: recombinase family protein [Syntrophales bacterium]
MLSSSAISESFISWSGTTSASSLSLTSGYCSFKSWKNYAVYREEGFSGKDLKRPSFQRMIADIQRGKINTVIVKKIDRLSRSIVDFENVYKMFDDSGVDLISIQENFDTSTAIGRSVIRIVLIFAQLEREQTSERTIDVMAYRAKQGLFNGGYPRLGYDIDYENKCLIPNESEIWSAKEIFTTYIRLGSLSKTARELNDKGYRLKSWTTRAGQKRGGERFQKNSVSRILNDPIYIGKVKYKNNIYDGQHQAIISEELFNATQTILQTNNVTKKGYRQNDNSFYLKGLVRCGSCRSYMAPSFAYSKGKKYFYYRCTADNDRSKSQCRIGSVHARKLEDLVVDELKFLAEDPRIIEGVVENATKEHREKVKEHNAKKNSHGQADSN